MLKRIIGLFFIACYFLCSAPALANKALQERYSLEPVSLQLKWKPQFQFAGYYAALEKGFYREEGLDVTIRPLLSSIDIVSQVESGQVNYAIGGTSILTHYANGQKIRALAAIFQHTALVFIAKQSSGIISPYEMAGKRIMFDGTTGNDAPLKAMLSDVGIKGNYITVPPSFSDKELISGEIDVQSVYITDQPFILKQKGVKFNIINPQNYGFDFYGDILYTSLNEIENFQGRAERFRRASLKGWEYALAHPEELIQLLKHKYASELSIEALRYEARETKKLILPDAVPLGQMKVNRLIRVANIYSELNVAPPLSEQALEEFVAHTQAAPLIFTEKEQAWLAKHPVIRVGVDKDYAPYEWVEKGEYKGLTANYLNLLEERIGVHFEIIKDQPWSEVLAMAKSGKLDILSCINRTVQREEFLFFTRPYVKNPIVIVNASRHGYIGSLSKLAGKTIAVERGYYTHDNLKLNHPEIKVLVVESTKEALTKVSTGEADAYLGDAAVADYSIKKNNLLALQFSGGTGEFTKHHIGVLQTHPELLSILNKAFNNITYQERRDIEKNWIGLTVTTGIQIETLLLIGFVISILFLLFLYWYFRLKKSHLEHEKSVLRLQSILDSSPVPQVLSDNNLMITHLNKSFVSLLGYQLEDIPTEKALWLHICPDSNYRNEIISIWQQQLAGIKQAVQVFEPIEVQVTCRDTSIRYVRISLTSTFDALNNELQLIVLYDITEQKRAEELNAQHQTRLLLRQKVLLSLTKEHFLDKKSALNAFVTTCATQLEVARVGIWFFESEHTQLVCRVFYNQGELSDPEQVLCLSDFPEYFQALEDDGFISADDVLLHPATREFSEQYLIPLGISSMMSTPIYSKGCIEGIICYEHIGSKRIWRVEEEEFSRSVSDLCTQALLEEKRQQAEKGLKLLARVFSDTHEGITITDANKVIVDVNPAFCDITGYSREEVVGKNPGLLSSGRHNVQFYTDMWQTIEQHGYWQGEVWNRRKNGKIYAELLSISTLWNEAGDVINYVGMFSDITQNKKQQEELTLMAHYDVLTGLPNRALFIDRFHQAIAHSQYSETQLAICFLDLDKFKPVNDNYGHDVGDQLLIQVSERIKGCLRQEDTVSRQGGDEFALLLGDLLSVEDCHQTLDKIHHALVQPFVINNIEHTISASSGFTLYPMDDGDIDTLLRHADQAMYQSKQLGRNQYYLFDTEQDQAIIHKHHRLVEIQQALLNNEFVLYYQPKINMLTGKVYGAEALIRWISPENGLIPPNDFLPLIDGTPLEVQVGNWVIEQALIQLEYWRQQGIRLEVSVNIASYHLQSNDFIDYLERILEKYPLVETRYLQLEILESSALGDLYSINNIIKTAQKALGVSIALDDFGTGYSSLTHLRSLSANVIKIDQSFVRDMLDDPDDAAIIGGIIGLSGSFNSKVIAEGVETTEHGLMLLMMGCYYAQGYGIAKPMPADNMPAWLDNYAINAAWVACANQTRSLKENRLQIFSLISQHWQNRVVENLMKTPSQVTSWPTMNVGQSYSTYWIEREKVGVLFMLEELKSLEWANEEIHAIAHQLKLQYQSGERAFLLEEVSELQQAFKDLNHRIGVCSES